MVKLLLDMGADAGRGYHSVCMAPNVEALQSIMRLLLDQNIPQRVQSGGIVPFILVEGSSNKRVIYLNGEIYIGQWLQVSPTVGYPHGYGRKWGDSENYEGQWVEGLKYGNGTGVWPSGERYEGSWMKNKRHGLGKQTYIDGTQYEGGWKDDVEYGYGAKILPNQEVYSGGFCDGKEMGFAVREGQDGRKYEGGIKKTQAFGYGVGRFKDGRKIDGGWKDGKAHGWGTETVGTLIHVGNFRGGFWEGPGTQTYGNKEVLVGEWKKGKFVKPPNEKQDKKK